PSGTVRRKPRVPEAEVVYCRLGALSRIPGIGSLLHSGPTSLPPTSTPTDPPKPSHAENGHQILRQLERRIIKIGKVVIFRARFQRPHRNASVGTRDSTPSLTEELKFALAPTSTQNLPRTVHHRALGYSNRWWVKLLPE
ncbi:unnamed protein product, partial [Ectocarpus fasciculatus]